MQYLTFRMNGVEFAVDVRIVETVVESGEITVVPSSIEYMRGAMDLRGRIVPVIDLRFKFRVPAAEGTAGGSVIVFSVEADGRKPLTIGALVDQVSEVVAIDAQRIETARSEGAAFWERYVSGVVRHDERIIVILEPENLFSLSEFEALGAA